MRRKRSDWPFYAKVSSIPETYAFALSEKDAKACSCENANNEP